ncbi:EamA family transporter RarD [Sulfuriroseicoccus oceanibius]|uniref:EamA family transporter RarD n=1 Tax=Sulfuriroseicoccus oceanibius TaxID=2707525 RepID=A0A6B3LDL9_9BACT|nr:EamA family transporter RarD [Sulfuriroseicoccus oceanibius]QQL45134.1 EamA family transporter RarD [Sulfuriroseicoccus oceanibius]
MPDTPSARPSNLHSGHLAALGAFIAWGGLTAYWKALGDIPALSVVSHRLLWSLIFLWILMSLRGRWGDYLAALKNKRTLGIHSVASVLIGTNWLLFIWATLNGHIVESALGYYLSPLVLIAIGAVLFKERLQPLQWAAVVCAVIGLAIQVPLLSRFPWIAVALSVTFASYALVRKRSPLGSLTGLAVETSFFFIPCAVWLTLAPTGGWTSITPAQPLQAGLLLGSGVVTALPLLWFAHAARTVRFATIGILQFIAPTMQFLLGVFLYHEPMPAERLTSFVWIWIAVLLYAISQRKQAKFATSEPTD